jgi:hypothetical protein
MNIPRTKAILKYLDFYYYNHGEGEFRSHLHLPFEN